MKLIFSHPTANANVRAVALGLSRAGLLSTFHTSIASFPGDIVDLLSKFQPLSEFRRRRFDPALKSLTNIWPWVELGRLLSIKTGFTRLSRPETGIFSIDSVYKSLDKHVASRLKKEHSETLNAVYAYEDGALATFTRAKKMGVKCIYDLPIAYWELRKNIMAEETLRMPRWKSTLGGGIRDSQKKLDNKTRELELADMVVTPSEFVVNSLPAWSKTKRVFMAPFGSPVANDLSNNTQLLTLAEDSRPLRVLFAGSMGQRKGLGDLFAAVRNLNTRSLELVVMGTMLAPMEFYREEFPKFIYEPGRSQEEVLALMRTCDVLCLPSLIEGRALVMQEAMSQGLPIIITPNTGGADLVLEGETGFLIPIRSPEAIAEKLCWFMENRKKIPEMGIMAKKHAAQYTWDQYSRRITTAISRFLA
jgi:glycosyltransferase involved in cell wall biosynthesis